MCVPRRAGVAALAIVLWGCSKGSSTPTGAKYLPLTSEEGSVGVRLALPTRETGGVAKLLVLSKNGEHVTVRFERMEINLVGPKDWKPIEVKVVGTEMETVDLQYPNEAFETGAAKVNRKFSYTTPSGAGQVEENDVAPPNPGFSTSGGTGALGLMLVEALPRDLEVELRSMRTKHGERLSRPKRLRIPAGKLRVPTGLTMGEPTQVEYAVRLLPNTYWTTESIPLGH